MRDRVMTGNTKNNSVDPIMLYVLIILIGLGLTVLFSASTHIHRDPYYFLKRQGVFACIGIILALFLSQISLENLRRLTPPLVLFALLLMLMTFVPVFSEEKYGARRWLSFFGYSFQPSELVKFALILYLANIFSKKEERIDDLLNTILPPLLILSIFFALVYLQNDFSTAIFIFCLGLIMFFVARVRLIYFLFFFSIITPLTVILLFTKEHRVQRLIAFLDPSIDPVGTGYQVLAARNALARGGLWGQGIGAGTKKLGGVPEVHSDFVFAVLGEELGFIGVAFILTLFGTFALRGFSIALVKKESYSYFLGFGLTAAIFFQAIFNIAVVAGMVPATGIPLPFFSSGGSSMIVTLMMVGVLLNISRAGVENEGGAR